MRRLVRLSDASVHHWMACRGMHAAALPLAAARLTAPARHRVVQTTVEPGLLFGLDQQRNCWRTDVATAVVTQQEWRRYVGSITSQSDDGAEPTPASALATSLMQCPSFTLNHFLFKTFLAKPTHPATGGARPGAPDKKSPSFLAGDSMYAGGLWRFHRSATDDAMTLQGDPDGLVFEREEILTANLVHELNTLTHSYFAVLEEASRAPTSPVVLQFGAAILTSLDPAPTEEPVGSEGTAPHVAEEAGANAPSLLRRAGQGVADGLYACHLAADHWLMRSMVCHVRSQRKA